MLRLQRVHYNSFSKLIGSIRRTPAYLRHAPPGLYLTCDFEKRQRHATLLIDSSIKDEPPLTNGTYLLSSTGSEDISFKQANSVLFGLPFAQDASQASYFTDTILNIALTRNGMEIPFNSIHTLIIPELHPFTAHYIKELISRLPKLKIACSPMTAAFLSDVDFFSGLRKTLSENDPHLTSKSIIFAELPKENILQLEENSTISVTRNERLLQVTCGDLTEARERWKRERKNKLKHFESYSLFIYDPAFYAVLAGPTAGVHFSWLPFIVHEANPAALLPLPDILSAQKSSNTNSLLEIWRVREEANRIIAAIKKFPETQRVLTACYGEVPGGTDGYIDRLQESVEKLEELRSRLGNRLTTDSVRDMDKWSIILEEKILKEVLFTNVASDKTETRVLDDFKKWANTSFSGKLSRTLAHSSATLPPDAIPKDTQKKLSSSNNNNDNENMETRKKDEKEGKTGVEFLKRHLEKRGMTSLTSVIEKEEIDVPVFLSMTPDDFKKVFKATFGVVKKMELLQKELRALQ